ncbi:hypothetical protein BdWA1_003320 [Babesia duncani]|uniref:Uncharacterized protein n=1 Tax=Babesia duncani TaxID=323732 RepID=A0AAD9UNA7_9APIC|nr:hypothetical protein BdWA1_003320 [Babesia duncani]
MNCILLLSYLCVGSIYSFGIKRQLKIFKFKCFLDFGVFKRANSPNNTSVNLPYCTKKLSEVPLFMVTFANSKPILLNGDKGKTCWLLFDPNDAINLLTEITQLLPSGLYKEKLEFHL